MTCNEDVFINQTYWSRSPNGGMMRRDSKLRNKRVAVLKRCLDRHVKPVLEWWIIKQLDVVMMMMMREERSDDDDERREKC